MTRLSGAALLIASLALAVWASLDMDDLLWVPVFLSGGIFVVGAYLVMRRRS